MSEQVQVVEQDVLLKAEGFWKKNQKVILIALVALLVLVGGWYAYNQFVVKPKEDKAQEALYKVQQMFESDSSNLVINGDAANGVKGALYIIKTYSGTKAANLASYYAGVSYLKLKDFNNAIKYLKDFSTNAKQVQLMAYTSLGHAYAESGKKEDAVSYYKKAGTLLEADEESSALNLNYAAQLLETMGKSKEALELYKEIKEKYPNTQIGYQMDKNINRIEVQPNDFSTK